MSKSSDDTVVHTVCAAAWAPGVPGDCVAAASAAAAASPPVHDMINFWYVSKRANRAQRRENCRMFGPEPVLQTKASDQTIKCRTTLDQCPPEIIDRYHDKMSQTTKENSHHSTEAAPLPTEPLQKPSFVVNVYHLCPEPVLVK